jgi:L-threonylcarbamoyladenylate synthase
MTTILKIDPVNPEPEKIRAAAQVIKHAGTVAFPTETVYGIGANGLDSAACRKIFSIKGRPADNPLILHIRSSSRLGDFTRDVSSKSMRLARTVWPGPLTMVLKKNPSVPSVVTAGQDTVAVRCPAHRIALRLIEESGVPIAAPSANISTRPSPTRFEHVLHDLDGKADVIIDGGDTTFGVESTIIDMTAEPPALLRPGAFTVDDLEKYIGRIYVPKGVHHGVTAGRPLAPGMKYRHYAPSKRLALADHAAIMLHAPEVASAKNKVVALLCSSETADKIGAYDARHASVIPLGSRKDLYEIAKNLFEAFRALDRSEAVLGIVERFEERGIGLAIMNRIYKATGGLTIESADELIGLLGG